MAVWIPIKVTISTGDTDIDQLGVFEAYTQGDTWNGFAVPYFTETEGRRIAEWTKALKAQSPESEVETVAWDNERQAFRLEDPQYPGEDEIIEGIWDEEAGEPLYGIGAYKWTWDLVEADTGADRSPQPMVVSEP